MDKTVFYPTGIEANAAIAAERDQAWQELRDIRAAIGADGQESTLDEVKRLRTAYGKAVEAMAAFDKWRRDGCEYHPLLLDELQSQFAAATAALAAVPAPEAEDAHDKMLDALNEMAADLGRGRYVPPAPDESDELWAGV